MKKVNVLGKEIVRRKCGGGLFPLVNRLPDPDPVLAKANLLYETYRDITYDPHVFAAIAQRKSGTAMLKWQMRKNSDDDERNAFIESCIRGLDTDLLITQMLDSVLYGFCVLEIIWKNENGKIVPARLDEKPQEWFYFDAENRLRYRDACGPEGALLPDMKYVLIQHQPSYANPYGERVLSRCYYPVLIKRSGVDFWRTFLERYGMPFLTAKQPRSSTQEEKDALMNALQDMIRDTVGVLPDDSSVEFMAGTQSATSEVYKKFIDFCNNEISKAILSQTLTTDIQERGTYAAARTHQNMLRHLQLGDKRLVEKAVNKLITMIWELNFGAAPGTVIPSFELYSEDDINKPLAERDRLIRRQGVRFTKEYYKRSYNLKDDEFSLAGREAIGIKQ